MWTTGVGGGPDEEWVRRFSAPENEVPVALPVSAVLARTATVALTLSGVQVYTTGVSFTLGLRCRPEALDLLGSRSIGDLVWEHGRPGPQLLFGVELADGRRASNVPSGREPFGADSPEDLVLSPSGGGGGQLSSDHSWWLSPLPPAGPLRLVVRCDPLGVPDTVTELDGAAVRAAAGDVVTLWPWVAPQDVEPPAPPALDLPPGSWFAGP